jgi:hypothetical protein
MSYGTAKVDTLAYTTITGETTVLVSGIYNVASTVSVFDPVTKNISTTGVISGSVYKVSGNVTVISGSGDIRPYGLYSFPTITGVSGQVLRTNADGTTSWTEPTTLTTAKTIALN